MELSILQKIIKDADTMGGISDNWFEIVVSLAAELNIKLAEFIPMQIKFLDNIKFNTPYCNELLNKRRDTIKKKLLEILSL